MWAALVAMVYFPGIACAWTETSYLGIVADARGLMPENIRWILEKYQGQLINGVRSGLPDYSTRSDLTKAILELSNQSVGMIKKDRKYSDAAFAMGRMAKLVAVLNHPLGPFETIKKGSWRTDYDIYLEKQRQHFRIRWTGVGSRPGTEPQLNGLLDESVRKTIRTSRILLDTFETGSIPIGSYDTQSIPFGIASITYSRAVTTTALTWLYIWDCAGAINRRTADR
jgi:hypothetical protein